MSMHSKYKRNHESSSKPPIIPDRMMKLILSKENYDEKSGDIEETFRLIADSSGRFRAGIWYSRQVLKTTYVLSVFSFMWSIIMFRNYLKIAFRNIRNQKGYSFINVTGLAIGIACSLLIMFWVTDELSIDKFHDKCDSLYMIMTRHSYGNEKRLGSGTPPALPPALKQDYPEIVNTARLQNGLNNLLVKHGNTAFKENIQFGDASLFEMFSFPLVRGSYEQAKTDIHTIILSEKIAEKYFGTEDPVGKSLLIENKWEFTVIGIMKEQPPLSTIRFSFYAPLEFLEEYYNRKGYTKTWYNCAFQGFAELEKGSNYRNVINKFKGIIKRHDPNTNMEGSLFPFRDRYLVWWGRGAVVTVFSIIAIAILTIACINFMNLATARSAKRAREVGLRKVIGAEQKQLIRQFFGESVIMTLISLAIAAVIAYFLLPFFRELTGNPLLFQKEKVYMIFGGIIFITVLTGLIAGSYPALFLSSFKPANVLKGSVSSGKTAKTFRSTLVVVQFVTSIILIIGTIVINNQLKLMMNKNLGYDKEHLVRIPLTGNLQKQYSVALTELKQNPNILSATVTSHSPQGVYINGQGWQWEGKPNDVNPLVTYFNVYEDFLETFKMKVVQGNFFKKNNPGTENYVLINERLAEIMDVDSPIGMSLTSNSSSYTIIGVLRNFHYTPLNRAIGPMIISYRTDVSFLRYRQLFVRIKPDNIQNTIASIKETVARLNPEYPFEYAFLDVELDRMYRGQERLKIIINYFAFLAIVISCLGLFGLASFTAEQRKKEIGIRKAMGASVGKIILLLYKEFGKWVLKAGLIAWPLSYFIMKGWLQNFPYRTGIGIEIFIITGTGALAIALITVSYQAIKAALTNPVDPLKCE